MCWSKERYPLTISVRVRDLEFPGSDQRSPWRDEMLVYWKWIVRCRRRHKANRIEVCRRRADVCFSWRPEKLWQQFVEEILLFCDRCWVVRYQWLGVRFANTSLIASSICALHLILPLTLSRGKALLRPGLVAVIDSTYRRNFNTMWALGLARLYLTEKWYYVVFSKLFFSFVSFF